MSTKTRLNEDAHVHSVSASLYWTLPGTAMKARGGYFHIWDQARGSDYAFNANGAFVGLTMPLPWKITADLGYEFTLEDYYRAAPHRRDPIQGVTARFTRPLSPQLTAYLEYHFNVDRSNYNFYRYTDNVIGAGVVWRF